VNCRESVEKLEFLWYNDISGKIGGVGMTEVVAALIWQGDKFMICQRPAHKARGLLWEFVGGKVEPGETKEQALIRECQEELAVTLSVGDVFTDVVHEYPDLTVHLTLFNAIIAEGEPQKLEHNDIQWITPSEIPNYEFCPADVEILTKIIERYSKR
jgi:8-oxo-dGTP diphosphatase